MLRFGSVADAKARLDHYDQIWVIMRSQKYVSELKALFSGEGTEVFWVPELSPSGELFSDFLKLKQDGNWSADKFDTWYTPRFLTEMQQPDAVKKLSELYTLSMHKDVLCVCSCLGARTCHRSLVNQIMCVKAPETMHCLVAGSRTFGDYSLMERSLDYLLWNFRGNVEIVSGGAKGADALAEAYAKSRGYELKIFPANWDLYGKQAGHIRNEQMHMYLAEYVHRSCVCFWDGESKGTADNFRLARQYGVPLKTIRF